jgi:hypothetical protein
MFGHLKPAEFMDAIDALDGLVALDANATLTDLRGGTRVRGLSSHQTRHLGKCRVCRDTLTLLVEMSGELDGALGDACDRSLASETSAVDWDRLRTGVRDGLLARSVKRSSVLKRWTGAPIRPAAAWGLSFALLISLVSLAGIWHYRTAHDAADLPADSSRATAVDPAGAEGGPGIDTVVIAGVTEAAAIEAGLLAWSGADLFSVLDGLEASEEELLRELLAQAEAEERTFGNGVLQ